MKVSHLAVLACICGVAAGCSSDGLGPRANGDGAVVRGTSVTVSTSRVPGTPAEERGQASEFAATVTGGMASINDGAVPVFARGASRSSGTRDFRDRQGRHYRLVANPGQGGAPPALSRIYVEGELAVEIERRWTPARGGWRLEEQTFRAFADGQAVLEQSTTVSDAVVAQGGSKTYLQRGMGLMAAGFLPQRAEAMMVCEEELIQLGLASVTAALAAKHLLLNPLSYEAWMAATAAGVAVTKAYSKWSACREQA